MGEEQEHRDEGSAGTRRVRSVERLVVQRPRKQWALLVGISAYEHERWKLQYADRDALELRKLLQSARGGLYEEKRVRLLLNQDATTTNILDALRSFLVDEPEEDDLVLIYFACHGSPVGRGDDYYFLAHDTKPERIAATAVHMDEIQRALRAMRAKRVVVLLDACHSGASAGDPTRAGPGGNDAAVIRRYQEELSKTRSGIAWLNSTERGELAQEDARWGGGHGVFTHCLLEGLRGKADRNNDGIIRIGELFEYVVERVKEETGGKQHPFIGTGGYDRDLPMVVVGDISAEEHHELGGYLHELGRRLRDPSRFRAAAREQEEALRFQGELGLRFPAALTRLGMCLVALKEVKDAAEKLKTVIDELEAKGSEEKVTGSTTLADARFWYCVALAKWGDQKELAPALEDFLKNHAQDDRASFILACKQTLQAAPDAALTQPVQASADALQFSGSAPVIRESKLPIWVRAVDMSERRFFGDLDYADLRDMEDTHKKALNASSQALHATLARGYLEKYRYEDAIRIAAVARETAGYHHTEMRLLAAIAFLRTQDYDRAAAHLEVVAAEMPELQNAFDLVQAMRSSKKVHVLLVGVESCAGVPNRARGALADVRAIEQALRERFPEDQLQVRVLLNDEVSAATLESELRDLMEKARTEPAMFHFSGLGSRTPAGTPTILPHDARSGPLPGDIKLSWLAELSRGMPSNLIAVIDAGWAPGDPLPWGTADGSRYAPPDLRDPPATRDLRDDDDSDLAQDGQVWSPTEEWTRRRSHRLRASAPPRIAHVTIYNASILVGHSRNGADGNAPDGGENVVEAHFRSPNDPKGETCKGALSRAIARSLRRSQVSTYEDLQTALKKLLAWHEPVLVGGHPSERLFSNAVQERQVQRVILDSVFDAPLHKASDLLLRRLARLESQSDSELAQLETLRELGIVRLALGFPDDAVEKLRSAGNLPGGLQDPDVLYYLGRALLERGKEADLNEAVSHLDAAVKTERAHPAAHYYLGKAIRQRIERQQLGEIEAAWKAYLDAGAPLGNRAEVSTFLTDRRTS